jgi:ethylbenzene dioxygenase subunit beta
VTLPLLLPNRSGDPPATSKPAPGETDRAHFVHRQLSQNAPARWQEELFRRASGLDGVRVEPSAISVPGARAFLLAPDASRGPSEAFMVRAEFAHLHPAHDGSLHLTLPPAAYRAVRDAGWGEPHPLVGTMMLFGPRDGDELEVAWQVLLASYRFATGVAEPVVPGSIRYAEVVDWLYAEAALLDGGREREWFDTMLSREIVYQVPMRQTVARAAGDGFVAGGFHLDERHGSLRARVDRNASPSAWTEDPPPRTRRFVTNIVVAPRADATLDVRSNLLIYRTRFGQTDPWLLSGERRDVLRREDGRLRLVRRQVLLDVSVLPVPNLAYLF